MSVQSILESIQGSAVAEWMRDTNPAMQVVEATHVLAAVIVLGTVLIVDLRLLGLPDSRRALTRIGRETLPLTWIAFGLAVVTGSLMFSTSAQTYFGNAAFQLKALALLGAGLNMALLQLFTARGSAAWDFGKPPRAARIAGLVSLLLWAAVVLLGRWIGFTKGYDFTIPPGVELVLPAEQRMSLEVEAFTDALRVRWTPIAGSAGYGVQVFALDGRLLQELETSDTAAAIELEAPVETADMPAFIEVTALDEVGQVLQRSERVPL